MKGFIVKHFTMQAAEIKGECRFSGVLATDRAGHLYDSRFRQALREARRPFSEKEMRTVEAMTALRMTARLTRQLMDRWAEKHGLSWAFLLCAVSFFLSTLAATLLPETRGKQLE